MNKKSMLFFLYALPVFLFCCFQTAAQSEEKLNLVEFRSQDGSIHLLYPEGWYIQEGKTELGYRVMITPQRPEPSQQRFEPKIIDLNKFYNASVTMRLGQGKDKEGLERYYEVYLKTAGGKVLLQQEMQVQGATAKLVELEAADSSGSTHHYLSLFIVRNDVLVTLFCEAPWDEFESYRNIFMNIIAEIEPFSMSSAHPDNIPSIDMVAKKGVACTFPDSWTNIKSQQSGMASFETSKDPAKKLIGYIKNFKLPNQTAQQWAIDEAKEIEAKGITVVNQPAEISAGALKWYRLVWESSMPYQGQQIFFKGEQYYYKDKETLVEVFLSAPKEIFGNMDKQELENFLSSVRVDE